MCVGGWVSVSLSNHLLVALHLAPGRPRSGGFVTRCDSASGIRCQSLSVSTVAACFAPCFAACCIASEHLCPVRGAGEEGCQVAFITSLQVVRLSPPPSHGLCAAYVATLALRHAERWFSGLRTAVVLIVARPPGSSGVRLSIPPPPRPLLCDLHLPHMRPGLSVVCCVWLSGCTP